MPEEVNLSRERLAAVFSTHDVFEARLVLDLLQANGIVGVLNGEASPNLFPFSIGDISKLEILVIESQLETAAQILFEHPPLPEGQLP